MEVATRIALLLLGLGIGDAVAEETVVGDDRTSPIFVVRAPPEPSVPLPKSPVQLQLAALLRSEIVPEPGPRAGEDADALDSGPVDPTRMLRLEKMTVRAPRLLLPPRARESAVEKFTRTGHLLEFSPTKRFMIGPKGDKVGLMFSFDW